MNLNKYHKEVISVAFDIFENNGDDSWMSIRDNPNLFNAYNQLLNACKPKILKPKNKPYGKDTIEFGNLTSKM